MREFGANIAQSAAIALRPLGHDPALERSAVCALAPARFVHGSPAS